MSTCNLPLALLDLVVTRAFASPTVTFKPHGSRLSLVAVTGHARRYTHAVMQRSAPPPPYLPPPVIGSLPSFPKSQLPDFVREAFPDLVEGTNSQAQDVSELEKRVKDLTSIEVASDTAPDDTAYTEQELLLIYEDLLAVEAPVEQEKGVPDIQNDHSILREVAQRLTVSLNRTSREQHLGLDPPILSGESSETLDSVPSAFKDVITRLEEIVADVGFSGKQGLTVSPGILTEKEWSALARISALEGNIDAVYHVFDLMKRFAHPVSEGTLTSVVSIYAEKGEVRAVEGLLQGFLTEAPSERQRDLHVKAYLRSSPDDIPTRALSILHEYESRALPAPQKTYTRCIQHLFSARTSVAHAHAWDLFSHMRYAAHPVPDALLYAMMIRACANSSFSTGVEPERALDLFHEMTVDKGIPPTSGAYISAILACACSGRKDYVHEAFRLAKEMLDSHRDAHGHSAFAPDARLFKALLEGAKRIGDLGRARWLLAEMVRIAGDAELRHPGSSSSLKVDEETVMHVFNAYASYRPPFRRSATKILDEPVVEAQETAAGSTEMFSSSSIADEHERKKDLVNRPQKSSLTHLPPQTRAELIAEVRLLMDQIVEQTKSGGGDQQARFKHVRLTPRLLNAYLSVHFTHSSVETCIELYRTLFENLGVARNAATYVSILEYLSKVRKDYRPTVKPLADEIWAEWEGVEDAWRRGDSNSLRMNARTVERANTAMIRLLSITGQLDRALAHVKSFVERYSFTAVRTPAPRHASRSTRIVLAAARPLVRLTSAVDIPDDTVPPLLTFPELELLHHKLVAAKDSVGIKYLKWVCKSYEGALRVRRDGTLQAREGGPDEEGPLES
ncbi:hypothetical protein BXZ70DRAFT_1012576 [Cristinia sonorae]|uniref:Pentatricopeptide repeat protein n=1 Tax=Cristinia sonorae TaxID=1940300 RepID=A0A8K0UEZ9_9AGAR|nr:hypothetical protein BXZ70DRAFT_1012576 [Cristinia sonorae]